MRPDLAVVFELSQHMPSKRNLLESLFAKLRRGRFLSGLGGFSHSDWVTIIDTLDRNGYVMWARRAMEGAYSLPNFVAVEEIEPLDELRLRRRICLECNVPRIVVERDVLRRHETTIGKKPLDWLDHFDEIAIAADYLHHQWCIGLYFRTDADAVHAKLAFNDIFYE